MKKLALLFPLALLAACGEEPAPQPVDGAAAPVAEATPSLPAPDQNLFTAKYAEACPEEEAVNTAVCKRAGLGSQDVICEFGLGEDEYLRNSATLTAGDGEWVFAEPDNVCVG